MPLAHKDRIRLHGGPYRTLPCRPGDLVVCDRFGTVKVKDFTDAPIPWPRAIRVGTGKSRIRSKKAVVRGGDLIRALKIESVLAISHWFGLGYALVSTMRQEYGVPRQTLGTHTLQKIRPLTEKHRRKFLAAGKAVAKLQCWPEHELALLGTMPDAKLARLIGRTLNAVSGMRKRYGIQPVRRRMRNRYWTEAEDRIIWHLTPREAEAHLPHRTIFQINGRQRLLRGTLRKGGRLVSPPPWIKAVRCSAPPPVVPQAGPLDGEAGIADLDARDTGIRDWSEPEAALVGTMPDVDLAKHLGRSLKSVRRMRRRRGVKSFRPLTRMQPWTLEEDRIIWHLGAAEAMVRLPHRNEEQIANRRRRLHGTARRSRNLREFLPPPAWIEEVKNVRPG